MPLRTAAIVAIAPAATAVCLTVSQPLRLPLLLLLPLLPLRPLVLLVLLLLVLLHLSTVFQNYVQQPYVMFTTLRNPLELFVSGQQYKHRKKTRVMSKVGLPA